MEEIRSMWCDTLEELLQCPVCLETAANTKRTTVHQCINGHHICSACKSQMFSCPLCKSQFINTRNLAVEHISAKLEDIKTSLLHPYHVLNRKVLEGKVCVATQTEDTCTPSTSYMSASCQTESLSKEKLPLFELQQEQRQQLTILPPKVGKGIYPCRIGSCQAQLAHGRMISHLRYYHKDAFYEVYSRCGTFKRNLNLEYKLQKYYNAYFVRGMGLFFLYLSIDCKGDLLGNVQIVNCNEAAKQFTYMLKVGSGPQGVCYSAAVKSCRVLKDGSADSLCVHDNNMRRITSYNNTFRCELTINRKIEHRANVCSL